MGGDRLFDFGEGVGGFLLGRGETVLNGASGIGDEFGVKGGVFLFDLFDPCLDIFHMIVFY